MAPCTPFQKLKLGLQLRGRSWTSARNFSTSPRPPGNSLEFASAIYLTDGTINLALLKYRGSRGHGLEDPTKFVGIHHFGIQVEDMREAQKKIEEAGGTFLFDLGDDMEKENFERKFKDPDGIIFDVSVKGWVGTTTPKKVPA